VTQATKSRSKWHRVNNRWTLSLGTRGARVRLFENPNGVYYRDVWIGGRKDRRSLKTLDRNQAERLGKLLLSELLKGSREESSPVVTLGSLWERFRTECPAWLDNSDQSRKDDARSAKILLAHFGENRDVSTLTEDDQVRYQNSRLKGGIKLPDGEVTSSVRARTVQADLELLRMMCRWAMTVRVGGRNRLLVSNPLEGLRFVRERNELRPVTTIERFTKTRAAMVELRKAEKSKNGRARWLKVELALVLAEATGRRLNSIRLLRWEDVDLKRAEILWRADADKKGREWLIPIPEKLRAELRQFRTDMGAVGGWIVPSEMDSTKPMDRYQFDKWLRVAESHAELPKLKGGLWHPYRRKWATERKDLPIKDVMAAGGWLDVDTLLRSYQHADRATLLRVMSEPHKLSQAV
jgi:integrase